MAALATQMPPYAVLLTVLLLPQLYAASVTATCTSSAQLAQHVVTVARECGVSCASASCEHALAPMLRPCVAALLNDAPAEGAVMACHAARRTLQASAGGACRPCLECMANGNSPALCASFPTIDCSCLPHLGRNGCPSTQVMDAALPVCMYVCMYVCVYGLCTADVCN
jgi:hypothetical protein